MSVRVTSWFVVPYFMPAVLLEVTEKFPARLT
jgi:hypothetical protein